MDGITALSMILLFLLAIGAGALLTHEKPPRPPDHITHTWDTRRD